MGKRLVRIKTDFVVEIDDDGKGLPMFDVLNLICDGVAKGLTPQGDRTISVLSGGLADVSLVKIVNGKLRGVTGKDMARTAKR